MAVRPAFQRGADSGKVVSPERERKQQAGKTVKNPEQAQALESLRLARTELERQLEATTNERRRAQIRQAIEEIDRRVAETRTKM